MSFDCCAKVTDNHCYGRFEGFLNKKAVEWCEKEEKKVPAKQLLILRPQSFLRY